MASPEDVRSFQLHLLEVRKVGWSSFNQAVCGLRFLFRTTYPRDWVVKMVPFGKRPKTLPEVLSGEEVSKLIECVTNIKHRAFLLTLYSAGLRLNEAAQLKIADIDSQRMQLRVTCGKGAKERRVPLSPRLLNELREYWKKFRPTIYLFPGRSPELPFASTTIQKVCKSAAAKAGIHRNITPHTMRHSFATHLLEAGVDLLAISRLLGHSSFSTTMKYLHVRQLHLHSVPSPADWLPVRQLPAWATPNSLDPSGKAEQNPPNSQADGRNPSTESTAS